MTKRDMNIDLENFHHDLGGVMDGLMKALAKLDKPPRYAHTFRGEYSKLADAVFAQLEEVVCLRLRVLEEIAK